MIGIDIVKINRLENSLKSDTFLHKVFSAEEIEYARTKADYNQTLAGIFAAKEAVVKALGTGITSLMLNQIVVKHTEKNQPFAQALDKTFNLSISHDGGFAIAVALKET